MISGHIELGSVEAANRRLAGKPFLSQTADLASFADLTRAVRALERDGDHLELPQANEAGAWDRLYTLYEKLSRRAPDTSNVITGDAFKAMQTDARLWSGFMALRTKWAETFAEHRLGDVVREYLGIEPDDLDNPIVPVSKDNLVGRVLDWEERYQRLSEAWLKFTTMKEEEWRVIPLVVEMRRVRREMAEMNLRMLKLEAERMKPNEEQFH